MIHRALAVTLCLLLALPGTAAEPGDPDLAHMKRDYEYGNFSKVLERARERLDHGRLTDAELLELHRYAGLSAHALKKTDEATRHLSAVLRADPDYSLDPFVTPPQAIAFFERLRREMENELEVVRRERRLRADQERRDAEERDRRRTAEEEQRRRIDALSRRVTIRSVEKRSYVANFLPFGAGQFQQGRNGVGTVLASVQGALAATSVVAYLARNGLYDTRRVTVDDRITADGTSTYSFEQRGIPVDQQDDAKRWRLVQYVSAAGFYLVWGAGVVDSLVHHEDEVVTISTEELRVPPLPSPPSRSSPARPPQGALLRPGPFVVPGGGVGAGLSGTF